MILRMLLLATMAATLVTTMLTAALAEAKVKAYERALSFVPAASAYGASMLRAAYATGTYVAPADSTVCISGDSPCGFTALVSVTLPGQSAPVASADCATAANCAANLQTHPAVAESRIGARIAIQIAASGGQTLVTRARFVTARTFAVAPYVAITGERDATDADRSAASEGDTGGLGSTQITVKYHDTTGSNADVETARWASEGWTNGNVSTGSWPP